MHVKRIAQFVSYTCTTHLLNVCGPCVFFTQVPAVRCTSARAPCGHSKDVIPKWKDPTPTDPDHLHRRRRPSTMDHHRWVNSGFADRVTYYVNTSTNVRAYCRRRSPVQVEDKSGATQTYLGGGQRRRKHAVLVVWDCVSKRNIQYFICETKTMCVTDNMIRLFCFQNIELFCMINKEQSK